jgi:UDP-2-acetamido-3-amino-2,3-dideoxy-glucuronate N-acetyltransferase
VLAIGVRIWFAAFMNWGALHTICDTNKELRGENESQFSGVRFIDSFKHLLNDPTIKAVVIATPAVYHYQMVKETLLARKHVFVEKPLALNVDHGEELVGLADEQDRILMVGHILHYHPAIEKLKELIDSGDLGKIQYIYSTRLNMGRIRSEENILWSFAPHDISVILLLLQNELPETVYATGGNYLQKHISDVTMTTMDFRSGVKAHIFVSWLHPFKEQKLVVVGDKKMAVFDDVSTEKLFLYPHRVDWVGRIPVAYKAEVRVVPIGSGEPLKAECRHFLKCIEEKQIPKTDGNEGLRVLRVLQKSQESLNNNGV